MPKVRLFTLGAIAAAIAGLAASVTALIDDLGGAPTFCAETGCELVRTSAWARPLGIPMSVLGVAFFTAALVLAFVRAPRLRAALAIAGGAWAVWLIVLQAFVIEAWCKLCMVADPSAIVYAACVLAGAQTLRATARRVLPLAPAAAAVVALLGVWTETRAPAAPPPGAPAPEAVVREQRDGVVTIVEYLDFECPFCRRMQERLERALAQTSTPVTIVRKMVPLPQHAGAAPAAVAYCCAEMQGKGEAMAKALFEAEPSELTEAGCEAIAERVGCDMARFRADVGAAQQRVLSDLKEAEAAGVDALPTLFIGTHRISGASASVEELVGLIDRQPRS